MPSCSVPLLTHRLSPWPFSSLDEPGQSLLISCQQPLLCWLTVPLCARPNQAGLASSSVCCPSRRTRELQLDRSVGPGPALEMRWLGKIMMNEGLTGEKWLLYNPYWSASWGLFHVEPKFDISNWTWLLNSSCSFRPGSNFRCNLGLCLDGETEALSMKMTYPK